MKVSLKDFLKMKSEAAASSSSGIFEDPSNDNDTITTMKNNVTFTLCSPVRSEPIEEQQQPPLPTLGSTDLTALRNFEDNFDCFCDCCSCGKVKELSEFYRVWENTKNRVTAMVEAKKKISQAAPVEDNRLSCEYVPLAVQFQLRVDTSSRDLLKALETALKDLSEDCLTFVQVQVTGQSSSPSGRGKDTQETSETMAPQAGSRKSAMHLEALESDDESRNFVMDSSLVDHNYSSPAPMEVDSSSNGNAAEINLSHLNSYFTQEDPRAIRREVLFQPCPLCTNRGGSCQCYKTKAQMLPAPRFIFYDDIDDSVPIELGLPDDSHNNTRVEKWIKQSRDFMAMKQSQEEFLNLLHEEAIGTNIWQVPNAYSEDLDKILEDLAKPDVVSCVGPADMDEASDHHHFEVQGEKITDGIACGLDESTGAAKAGSHVKDLLEVTGCENKLDSSTPIIEDCQNAKSLRQQLEGTRIKVIKLEKVLDPTSTETDTCKTNGKKRTSKMFGEDITFKCPAKDCGKLYMYRSSLGSHLRSKHPELVVKQEKPQHFCSGCDAAFSAKTRLAAHRRECGGIQKYRVARVGTPAKNCRRVLKAPQLQVVTGFMKPGEKDNFDDVEF